VALVVSFFFFQAEDGIRDLTVTGVQTCALPILAGKEWEGDLLRPVLPPAPALDEGQEGLDVPLDQLTFNDLLVAGARPDHVPEHPELTVSRDLGRSIIHVRCPLKLLGSKA